VGKPREIVYTSTVPIHYDDSPIRIFKGELVYEAEQTYSCDAANGQATRRALGDVSTNRMTSDGQNLYWCTLGQGDRPGELRRVARNRR
jgi:hypothetical protein